MDNRKIIIAGYVGASFVLWYLTRQSIQGLYVAVYQLRRLPGITLIREFLPAGVGIATFIILMLHPRVNVFLEEVVSELKKFTWPTREDVVKSTIVVLGCVLFASGILALFDVAFGRAISYFLHS